MEKQSEIDGTLLNPVSLTDLIKAQTKETAKRERKADYTQEVVFFFCVFLYNSLFFSLALKAELMVFLN